MSTTHPASSTSGGWLRRGWPAAVAVMAIAAVLAWWVEARIVANWSAGGTLLLVPAEGEAATLASTGLSTADLVARINRDEPAVMNEDIGVWSDRRDASEILVFASSDNRLASSRALEETLAWVRDHVAAEQDTEEGGPVVVARSSAMSPPTWRDAEGDWIAGAHVLLDDSDGGDANPYHVDPTTLRLLQIEANSDRGKAELRRQLGATLRYEVYVDRYDAAPVMAVDVTTTNPDDALRAFDLLAAFMATELDDRQARAGVTEPRRHRLEVVARPVAAERVGTTPALPTLGTLLAGAALALGSAWLFSAWRARARRPRQATPRQTQAPVAYTAPKATTERR